MKYILALHALEAGDHISDGVIPDVAHMQFTTGIGKHGEAVEFLLPAILCDLEAFVVVPILLDAGFNQLRLVLGFHCVCRA
jgi:hypothetical protein